MDNLPALPWGTISPWTLVAVAIVGVLTGRLVPWVTWRAWQTAWNEQLTNARAENARLHEAVQKQVEALELYNSQLKQLLEATKATEVRLASLYAGEVQARGVVEAKDPQGRL